MSALPECFVDDPVRARILYMTTLPLADVRAQLSKLVDEAVRTHERFEITKNGHRAAVLISADEYDSLQETIAVLSDPELVQDIFTGLAQIEAGDTVSAEEAAEMMRVAGRLPRASE